MTPERIRELARKERADGSALPPTDDDIDFLIRFEQRYGWLWYPVLGSGGMEHSLDGEATLYETDLGFALPSILDGDFTQRMYILTDGRTIVRSGRQIPSRVIDSGIAQRIEGHALLAEVRRWPHRMFQVTAELYAEPKLSADQFPAPVPEATGPANRWWLEGDHAVFAHLRSWWRPTRVTPRGNQLLDRWTLWYFAREVTELDGAADRLERAVADFVQPDEDWCMLCGRFVARGERCVPSGTERRLRPPGR